ncbi:hypothetical protein ACFL11_00165 [Patescibacteria group bacterium]
MSKFSKILIFIFLAISISLGFIVFYSNSEKNKNNVFAIEISDSSPEDLGSVVYICPEATSLEKINPLCKNIIVLAVGESKNGMVVTITTYNGQEYYVVSGFQNGGGGEFGFIEKSIKDISDYIQNLPDEAFNKNSGQRKKALKSKLEEVFLKIESQEYQAVINKLQKDIRAKVDGDPRPEDWIMDPTAQQEICEMIDSLASHLQELLQ